MWQALGYTLGALACTVGAPCGLLFCSERLREQWSAVPMGLWNPTGKGKKHGVMRVDELADVGAYAKTLSQGAARNIRQADANLQKRGIVVRTGANSPLRLLQLLPVMFGVIYSHERRMYSPAKAFLVSFQRWAVQAVMCGTLDEYWTVPAARGGGGAGGRPYLVAVSHSVVKGRTLRGMWFYQRAEYGRCGIWFHTVQLAVARAIALKEVAHVDVGPSREGSAVAALKAQYGFAMVDDWQTKCDYSGRFRNLQREL